jgi:cytoskeletal protein CcmA (bactofilin family)
MSAVKPALRIEPKAKAESKGEVVGGGHSTAGQRLFPLGGAKQSGALAAVARPRRETGHSFQAKVPVITGEATYRGLMPVDGIITGTLGAAGSSLTVKQRPRNAESVPELNGEIGFKDMLRINGHVAGKIFSFKGTLIVDGSATLDAVIDVAVAVINGTVNGDIIGHQRVELGPAGIVIGSISTRSLAMKPGATFHGDCRMLKAEEEDGDR